MPKFDYGVVSPFAVAQEDQEETLQVETTQFEAKELEEPVPVVEEDDSYLKRLEKQGFISPVDQYRGLIRTAANLPGGVIGELAGIVGGLGALVTTIGTDKTIKDAYNVYKDASEGVSQLMQPAGEMIGTALTLSPETPGSALFQEGLMKPFSFAQEKIEEGGEVVRETLEPVIGQELAEDVEGLVDITGLFLMELVPVRIGKGKPKLPPHQQRFKVAAENLVEEVSKNPTSEKSLQAQRNLDKLFDELSVEERADIESKLENVQRNSSQNDEARRVREELREEDIAPPEEGLSEGELRNEAQKLLEDTLQERVPQDSTLIDDYMDMANAGRSLSPEEVFEIKRKLKEEKTPPVEPTPNEAAMAQRKEPTLSERDSARMLDPIPESGMTETSKTMNEIENRIFKDYEQIEPGMKVPDETLSLEGIGDQLNEKTSSENIQQRIQSLDAEGSQPGRVTKRFAEAFGETDVALKTNFPEASYRFGQKIISEKDPSKIASTSTRYAWEHVLTGKERIRFVNEMLKEGGGPGTSILKRKPKGDQLKGKMAYEVRNVPDAFSRQLTAYIQKGDLPQSGNAKMIQRAGDLVKKGLEKIGADNIFSNSARRAFRGAIDGRDAVKSERVVKNAIQSGDIDKTKKSLSGSFAGDLSAKTKRNAQDLIKNRKIPEAVGPVEGLQKSQRLREDVENWGRGGFDRSIEEIRDLESEVLATLQGLDIDQFQNMQIFERLNRELQETLKTIQEDPKYKPKKETKLGEASQEIYERENPSAPKDIDYERLAEDTQRKEVSTKQIWEELEKDPEIRFWREQGLIDDSAEGARVLIDAKIEEGKIRRGEIPEGIERAVEDLSNPTAETGRLKSKALMDRATLYRTLRMGADQAGVKIDTYMKQLGVPDKTIEKFNVRDPETGMNLLEEPGVPLFDAEGNELIQRLPGKEHTYKEGKKSATVQGVDQEVRRDLVESLRKAQDEKLSISAHIFKTPQRVFEQFGLEGIFNEANTVLKRNNDLMKTIVKPTMENMKNLSRESAQRISRYAIAQQKNGKNLLNKSGTTPLKWTELTEAEQAAYTQMRKDFDQTWKLVNDARISMDKKPMDYVENYFTFMREASGNKRLKNIDILDPVDATGTEAIPLPNLKKRGKGRYPLELDAIEIYSRYMDQALKYATRQKFISDIQRAVNGGYSDVVTGKKVRSMRTGDAKSYIDRTLKVLADKGTPDKHPLTKGTEKILNAVSQNLAASFFAYNLKTAFTQPAALIGTWTETGTKSTLKGIQAMMTDPIGVSRRAREMSNVLDLRAFGDAFFDRPSKRPKTKTGKAYEKVIKDWGFKLTEWFDTASAIITWEAAMDKAARMKKENGSSLTLREKVNYADNTVLRTQASGHKFHRSPIQQNAIGRALTLFQTFAINDFGYLINDVYGIKRRKKITRGEAIQKILKYEIGTALLGSILSESLDFESPVPSPIGQVVVDGLQGDDPEEMALNFYREMLDRVPVLGGARYNNIMGPIGNWIDEATPLLREPWEHLQEVGGFVTDGDISPASKRVAQAVGRGAGLPVSAIKNVIAAEEDGISRLVLSHWRPSELE